MTNIDNIFNDLGTLADELNLPCYVVGGWVRDFYLGVPSDDIDIVVEGDGTFLAQKFAEKTGSSVNIFKTYGTAKVSYEGIDVEFVGARSESYPFKDTRNPVVRPGTLLEDLTRRDFTINAMALCLNKDRFGVLVDPFNGLQDLKNKVIVTPTEPGITFSDDPLRMLRCIRFSTKLKFQIEENTLNSVIKNSQRLSIVSKERIMTEFFKILSYPNSAKGIKLLQKTGLLVEFLPEVSALDETDDGRHKNNFYHSVEVLGNICNESDNVWLRFAALLHDIGKDPCKRRDPATGNWTFYGHPEVGARLVDKITERLKLSKSNMEYVKTLVKLHMRPQKIAEVGVTDSAVRRILVDAGDYIKDLLLLSKCDITTKHPQKKEKLRDNMDLLEKRIDDLVVSDWRRDFQPCVNGFDIMEIFGITLGPNIGLLKEEMKNAILDEGLPNEREVLLNFIEQYIKNNSNIDWK